MFTSKGLVIGLIFLVIAAVFWYYCMDTLMFSEVIGNDVSSQMGIFINLLDFDTQLSRMDLYHLKSKARKWEKRLQDIELIRNPTTRSEAYKKIVREITADPSMKKIIRKASILGKESMPLVLKVINAF